MRAFITTSQLPFLPRAQRGLTLVELMVAMVLSLLLSAGVIVLFVGSGQNTRFNEGLARVQENGRFAIDVITHDTRMAGYVSLLDPPGTVPQAVDGLDNVPINHQEGGRTVVEGTDVLILSAVPDEDVSGQEQVFAEVRYFLSVRQNAPVPSLYRFVRTQAGATRVEEVVEGVANLQILYGENTDDDAPNRIDRYVAAGAVDDWNRVLSVRLSMLLVSPDDNVLETSQTISFNGSDVNPGDRRLRQVVTTTIAVRNNLR